MRAFSLLPALLLSALLTSVAVAQTPTTYDGRTLTSLYEAQLKRAEPDPYIEKRINDERAKIRTRADDEVRTVTEPATKEDADPTALPKALDRQRSIVSTLEELLRDRKVDLDLLVEEEKTYGAGSLFGTGSTAELRTTTSHGELLAKKAIAEERIASLQAALTLQRDRLGKLTSDQRLEQLGGAFWSLSYVLIILAAVLIDRLIRRRIIRRFQDKSRRYIVAKAVSASIYAAAIVTVVARLLSDHPEALASLAIIGAGIAIALQDVIKDVVSWIIIMQRRLYRLGDRVSIGAFTGDVVDIGLLRTTLLDASTGIAGPVPAHEHTGKLLVVPNSLLLREPVANFNAASDYVSAEISMTIAYTPDWPDLRTILEEVVAEQAGEYSELARKQQRRRTSLFYTSWEASPPRVHVSVASNGIVFLLTFLAPIGQRRETQTKISEAILSRLLERYEVTTKENVMTLTPRT